MRNHLDKKAIDIEKNVASLVLDRIPGPELLFESMWKDSLGLHLVLVS